jgi:DnaJ-class molecular chaperone
MTKEIRDFLKRYGALECPACDGNGEYDVFSGHHHSETCSECAGKGLVKSLNRQQNQKKCVICNGRARGCGGCDHHPKGMIEWGSYEIFKAG